MTPRTHRFPLTGTVPSIKVRNPAGSIAVEAREGADELAVEVTALDASAEQVLDRVDVVFGAGRLRVEVPERRLLRAPRFAVTVSTPPGADVRVAAASADTRLRGRLGRAELTSASGDVDVEECGTLELRTASGDGRVGIATGRLRAASASGDLHVDAAAGGLSFRTASGDVSVGEASGEVSVATASGDVSIDRITDGTVQVKTMSGDAEVGVAPGQRVWLDLSSVSGRMDSQLADDDASDDGPAQVSLALRSVSGNLRIRRAATAI